MLARLNLARIAFETKNTQCESAIRKYGQTDWFIFPTNPPKVNATVCNSALDSPVAPILFPYLMELVRSRNPKVKARTLSEVKALCPTTQGSIGGASDGTRYTSMPGSATPFIASSVFPSPLRLPVFAAAAGAICFIPPVSVGCAAVAKAAVVAANVLYAVILAAVAKDIVDGVSDRAGDKTDLKVDPRVIECDLIWQGYEPLKNCGGCKATDSFEERTVKRTCWGTLALGRRLYLDMRCDYILPGSIANGSAAKEAAHILEWQKAVAQVKLCETKPQKPTQ